jgi:hypothetical protein
MTLRDEIWERMMGFSQQLAATPENTQRLNDVMTDSILAIIKPRLEEIKLHAINISGNTTTRQPDMHRHAIAIERLCTIDEPEQKPCDKWIPAEVPDNLCGACKYREDMTGFCYTCIHYKPEQDEATMHRLKNDIFKVIMDSDIYNREMMDRIMQLIKEARDAKD